MEPRALEATLADGVVSLRCPETGDAEQLIAGRDSEFRRFIGEGSPNPEPTAVVLNPDNQIVGWIDFDVERAWLAEDAMVATATLLIDPANEPSIGVAHRGGFEQCGDVEGQLLLKRYLRQR